MHLRGQKGGSKEDGTHLEGGVFQPCKPTVTHPTLESVRISRKEGQRFTACRSTVSHQVGPVLVKQDVVDFHSVTYAGQALDGYPRARARAH